MKPVSDGSGTGPRYKTLNAARYFAENLGVSDAVKEELRKKQTLHTEAASKASGPSMKQGSSGALSEPKNTKTSTNVSSDALPSLEDEEELTRIRLALQRDLR